MKLLLVLLAASCAAENAEFRIESSALTHEQFRISMLGVFRDGRMDAAAWQEIGPRLSAVFGAKPCELGFGERLHDEAPDLFSKVDEYSKDNGVTDETLKQFAGRATGNLIMAMTVAGRPPVKSGQPQSLANRQSMRGGRRGMRSSQAAEPVDENSFEVSVSLFSVDSHEIVATLGMRYTGSSEEDAFKLFAARLQTMVPNATCAAWKWKD